MSIRRITISVPADTARRMKKVAARKSVSAWVTRIIEEHLGDAELDALWEEFYRSVNPRAEDVRKATVIFRKLTKRPGRKSAA